MWRIEGTDEFDDWYQTLDARATKTVNDAIDALEQHGPMMRRPKIGEVKGSAFDPHMKEIRISAGGRQLRILFVFDPRRAAILLIGGDKTGAWKQWYREAIPVADELYRVYLNDLRKEGEI